MPLFKTRSAAVCGIDAHPVDVEVDLYRSGMARDFMLVGMPDTAVRESRERIKSALMNSGFGYPNQAVTVNLAPAHVRKEGAGFDLPMALAILGAMGTFKGLDKHLSVGELSLDGAIRPVRGALSVAVCARENHIENLILPVENAAEASVVEGVNVFGVKHLAEVVAMLTKPENFTPVKPSARPAGRSRFRIGAGFSRRARTDHGQARLAGGRGRRPQRPHDRSARLGQNHAGEEIRGHSAAAEFRRSHRDHQDPQHRGRAAARRRAAAHAAVPHAAPHDFRCGPDRRRHRLAAPWRSESGAQRRALPRRISGVSAQRSGDSAPAARRS